MRETPSIASSQRDPDLGVGNEVGFQDRHEVALQVAAHIGFVGENRWLQFFVLKLELRWTEATFRAKAGLKCCRYFESVWLRWVQGDSIEAVRRDTGGRRLFDDLAHQRLPAIPEHNPVAHAKARS